MSDSENDNLPSGPECLRRCQEFATVTNTDSALAMFYLQDVEWDLEVKYLLALEFIHCICFY